MTCYLCKKPAVALDYCPDGMGGCETRHFGCTDPACEGYYLSRRYRPPEQTKPPQPEQEPKIGFIINQNTMLFQNITAELRVEMLEWAKTVILKGQVPYPDPEWVSTYFRFFGFDDNHRLLMISTALPQRVLLSLLMDPA